MNWKNRLTNYNFWISIFSAVLLILQALKIEFDFIYINEIFTAVLGLLVVIGIINDPTRTSVKTTETTQKIETKQETLPTDKEDETNNGDIQNDNENVLEKVDVQAVLNKISIDLDEKIKELASFNKEAILKLNTNTTQKLEEETASNVQFETAQNVVDELENPYVDIVK